MIYLDTFKGLKSIVIENENIRATFLPEYGSKMSSLINKKTNKEFLFQAKDERLTKPPYGADFSKYDSSGFDEVFPSIDKCLYPDSGLQIPDHGEVWALSWDYSIDEENEVIHFEVKSPKFPYILRKRVKLLDNTIKLEYEAINTKDEEFKFIWTPHILLNCSVHTRIIVPEDLNKIISVEHSTEHLGEWGSIHNYPLTKSQKTGQNIDLSRVEPITANNCEKFYFLRKLSKGYCGIIHEDTKDAIFYEYPSDKIPYLGIWKTQGGYRGDYNIALEPCTGVYDNLYVANSIRKVSKIPPKGKYEWWFNIKVNSCTRG